MTKEELIGICNALVSITDQECCSYGFNKDIDRAEEYLNESEKDFLYKEKWERLDYLLNKTITLMKDKYDQATINKDKIEFGDRIKLWQELQTFRNVRYLVYQLEHTRDVSQVDIVIGGDCEEVDNG